MTRCVKAPTHGSPPIPREKAVFGYLGVVEEGVRALGLRELPNLDGAVAGGGDEVRAVGVEVQVGQPAGVPLSGHD